MSVTMLGSTTSRDIEKNIGFNFGFVLTDVHVPMTMGAHEIEARGVTLQRTDLEGSYEYTVLFRPSVHVTGHKPL
jgi:hypothetical protein